MDMNSEQHEFFRQNGYVVLQELLPPPDVDYFLEIYECDHQKFPNMWCGFGDQTVNCDTLLTTPEFDRIIRHPVILPEIEALMGGPVCFGEICIRHMAPYSDELKRGWHRDMPHWPDHPLRMDYIQLMLYLTDVHQGTHCFSLSPESVDDEVLEKDAQLERGGIVDFHGPPGTVVLFNVSVLHTATVRKTDQERKTVQIYYGHQTRPYLSNCTVIPESFWRDHEDVKVREFYGVLNRKTRRYLAAHEAAEIDDHESILEWCTNYDRKIKQDDNAARPEGDEGPAAGGQEHGTLGE